MCHIFLENRLDGISCTQLDNSAFFAAILFAAMLVSIVIGYRIRKFIEDHYSPSYHTNRDSNRNGETENSTPK